MKYAPGQAYLLRGALPGYHTLLYHAQQFAKRLRATSSRRAHPTLFTIHSEEYRLS